MQTIRWYYRRGDVERGPVSAEELRALRRSGHLSADAEAAQEGDMSWRPIDACAPLCDDRQDAVPIDGARARRSLDGAALGSAAAAATALLTLGCLPMLSPVLGAGAVALGVMALRAIAREPDVFRGRRVAWASMGVGVVAAALGIAALALYAYIGPPAERGAPTPPAETAGPDAPDVR